MVIGEGKKSKIKNQKAKLQIKIQKSVSHEKAQKTHRKVQPQTCFVYRIAYIVCRERIFLDTDFPD
ncbi:unnamed protein product [marine sediment metagenome]|uniref:Uncharacterized protein n=1 Tax=marine sediment metagenome TaxID=412755 RepID=X1L8K0_9ZZZZ